MNCADFPQVLGEQARIPASPNVRKLLARTPLCSDSRENLANQSTIDEEGAGTHCLNGRFTDGTVWLFQRQPREQRCSLEKKSGHRFESWRDHAADVAAPLGNHIESHCCAEVH